jgi:hypothetical protein
MLVPHAAPAYTSNGQKREFGEKPEEIGKNRTIVADNPPQLAPY